MSRHSKQIYEDVAEVFHGEATVDNLAHDFADLFALTRLGDVTG